MINATGTDGAVMLNLAARVQAFRAGRGVAAEPPHVSHTMPAAQVPAIQNPAAELRDRVTAYIDDMRLQDDFSLVFGDRAPVMTDSVQNGAAVRTIAITNDHLGEVNEGRTLAAHLLVTFSSAHGGLCSVHFHDGLKMHHASVRAYMIDALLNFTKEKTGEYVENNIDVFRPAGPRL
jgi:hypothetical protein